MNAFWRAPGVRSLASETHRRYAHSLKVWLDFLHVIGSSWRLAGRAELAAFKEWRLSADLNPAYIEPSSFCTDRSAIRRFYEWVGERVGVENPVRARVINDVFYGAERVVLEGTPSGIRRADVKWLTPEAFKLWRNIGLRGFTSQGLPSPRWHGQVEDRDVAFAEGLYGTGLRNREWSSVLLVELPEAPLPGLFRGRVASVCAKRATGRPFWMRRRVAQQVRFYLEEGSRPAAVDRAQRAGRYEAVRGRWMMREVRPGRLLRVVDEDGLVRDVGLDALPLEIRMRLFKEGPGGLEPLWLWLNHDGTPRPKEAWNKTFDRANRRVAKALATWDGEGAPVHLWCRPHMLRHSFALRWFCIATFVAWQRTGLLSEEEQRDFRNQLGDVWFLLSTLLGHRSVETTREVYLEPFQALQVDQLVGLMDADDRAALERLVETMGLIEPRVLTGAGA